MKLIKIYIDGLFINCFYIKISDHLGLLTCAAMSNEYVKFAMKNKRLSSIEFINEFCWIHTEKK